MSWLLLLGAAGGIGSATAMLLQRREVPFVGLDRAIAGGTPDLHSLMVRDLNSPETTTSTISDLCRERGVPTGAIVCTGTYNRSGLEEYTPVYLRTIMHDNFEIVFWAAHCLVPLFARNGGGRFIVTTSQAGVTGGLDPGYAAAKGACSAFVKSLAREFGSVGIRCNAVSPGPVETARAHKSMGAERVQYYRNNIPIKRLVYAQEVAELLVYLALDAPDALNGTTLDIDGGLVRR